MPLREMQRTSSPSQRLSNRTPSYLSSNTQPSVEGASSTSVASIGLMLAGSALPRVPLDLPLRGFGAPLVFGLGVIAGRERSRGFNIRLGSSAPPASMTSAFAP